MDKIELTPEELQRIIQEAIRKEKEEEEKRKREDELREKYRKKIWDYMPGAKLDDLDMKELEYISRTLESIARRVQYKPRVSKQTRKTFFGINRWRKVSTILTLVFMSAVGFKLRWG